MSICSVPSLSHTLSDTQQVHKTSKRCLLRASGHLATRQEDVRDTSNATGWDCAIFPKFLESKCGLREVEGHMPSAPPGSLFTSPSSFPPQPHEVEDMTLISQMRALKIREDKSLPQSRSDSCCNLTEPGT